MKTQQKTPLYRAIYESLLEKIVSGQYATGCFLPSERILSELYSVERPTLRRSLSILEEEGYIQKIRGAGSKVLYSTDNATQNETDAANTVVYVMPDSEGERGPQPYHMEICHHLEKLFAPKKIGLIMTKARSMGKTIPQWMYSDSIIGTIWVSGVNDALLDAAKKMGLPSVLSSNDAENFPKVNLDDIQAGYLATSHLIEQGCRRVAHVTGIIAYKNAQGRMEGYRRALLSHGLPYCAEDVYSCNWSYEGGYKRAESFLGKDSDIDGVFAANDMMALGVLNYAVQNGYSVPEQLKVAGVDNIEQARNNTIPLTTISFSKENVASALFCQLTGVFDNQHVPEEIIMPAKLLVRGSSV